ncbi:MAG TPA: hypothetical protein VIK62_05365 [Verrucomicrobiae bacterium]
MSEENIYDWLARVKPQMTHEVVQKVSKAKLAELHNAGIKMVGVLASPNSGEFCEACAAIAYTREEDGVKIEIEFAQPLPLPGCDRKLCMCEYIAVE